MYICPVRSNRGECPFSINGLIDHQWKTLWSWTDLHPHLHWYGLWLNLTYQPRTRKQITDREAALPQFVPLVYRLPSSASVLLTDYGTDQHLKTLELIHQHLPVFLKALPEASDHQISLSLSPWHRFLTHFPGGDSISYHISCKWLIKKNKSGVVFENITYACNWQLFPINLIFISWSFWPVNITISWML